MILRGRCHLFIYSFEYFVLNVVSWFFVHSTLQWKHQNMRESCFLYCPTVHCLCFNLHVVISISQIYSFSLPASPPIQCRIIKQLLNSSCLAALPFYIEIKPPEHNSNWTLLNNKNIPNDKKYWLVVFVSLLNSTTSLQCPWCINYERGQNPYTNSLIANARPDSITNQ